MTELPNFSVERKMLPSVCPDLPPRQIIILSPTLDQQTPDALFYQQKVAEELEIHQQIWGIVYDREKRS